MLVFSGSYSLNLSPTWILALGLGATADVMLSKIFSFKLKCIELANCIICYIN